MRALNVLLAILVSLAIAFGVFEFGLRLFPAFRQPATINQFDADLGWAKEPGASVSRSTPEFSITFEINDQGLRDDNVVVPKPEGVYRVVCLGDSFVLGYTVDREDLFVDLLEAAYDGGATKVEFVNAGTEGWSTDQEVVWFQEYGAAMDPDMVLLFPYENDIYWSGQESYHRFPKPRFEGTGQLEERTLADPGSPPFIQSLASFRALGLLASQLIQTKDRPHNFDAGEDRWIPSEFGPLLVEPPAFVAEAQQRVESALQALAIAAGDATVIVCPIPSESAIQADSKADFAAASDGTGLAGLPDDQWSPDIPVDFYIGIAEKLGMRAIDPRVALRTAFQANPEAPLYFDIEWHLTPRGNRVLAGFLAAELGASAEALAAPDLAAFSAKSSGDGSGGIPTWLLVYLCLWAVLGTAYAVTYRGEESAGKSYLGVGLMLGSVFTIIIGGHWLMGMLPATWRPFLILCVLILVLGFVAYKLGRRLGTIAELLKAFTLRGHWYLMPLVVVLLSIGSLLVVAASSPLIAPFIYTLF